jgi:hypothetical protein
VGFCEHGVKTEVPITREEFVDWLSDCQFLKKNSASYSCCAEISQTAAVVESTSYLTG